MEGDGEVSGMRRTGQWNETERSVEGDGRQWEWWDGVEGDGEVSGMRRTGQWKETEMEGGQCGC